MRIILIRHGQTNWNLERRYQGSADTCLNTTGHAQASMLARRFKGERIDRVYSSDRRRSREFASMIFTSFAIEPVPDLREVSFGIFEGLTYDEILARHSEIYKKWIKDPFGVTIPGGESPDRFVSRVMAAFDKIVSSCDEKERLAIVTHGGPISVIANGISGAKSFWEKIPDTASVSVIEIRKEKRLMKAFNDTSHLKNG